LLSRGIGVRQLSRPRSDDKRKAILEAAFKVVAERGIAAAPTSAISKEAGVAEGSLFTYFKTKDELMNELYLDLRTELSRRLPDFPHKGDAYSRLRYIWDRYLELGMEKPEQLKVLAQLRSSGKLFKEDEAPGFALLEVLKAISEAVHVNDLRNAPPEYLVLMVRAQAEITVEFINAHPEHTEVCRELGFKMLWMGLAGK
jgi:AcrR family transcriptional regulator